MNKRPLAAAVLAMLMMTSEACAAQEPEAALLIRSFSFGPGVTGVILQMEQAGPLLKDVVVTTDGRARQVSTVCYCDEAGQPIEGTSDRILISLTDTGMTRCQPFGYETGTGFRSWLDTYPVELSAVWADSGEKLVLQQDCIERIVCPDLALFTHRIEMPGSYERALTGETVETMIRMAAYEPEELMEGKHPLIIWLHGAGEGGTCLDAALIGNEVSLLAQPQIQSHFTSDDGQTGAFVLIPQCDTMWMDEGDGLNGQGEGISCYTTPLMDAINEYMEINGHVDRDRIYLGGCSNGGYMTLNMCAAYPGTFAAAFPVCEAFDTTKDYERIDRLTEQPAWFVQSADDPVVDPEKYVIPTYADLIYEDAADCWLSMFNGYGHAVWNAVFYDRVNGVQDPQLVSEEMVTEPDAEKGGSYENDTACNLFDWLNVHTLSAE